MGGAKPCRKYGSTMVQLNEKTGWVGQKFLGPNFSLHTGLVCTSFGGFPLIGWTSQFCSLPWVPLVPFLEFTIVPFSLFLDTFLDPPPLQNKIQKKLPVIKSSPYAFILNPLPDHFPPLPCVVCRIKYCHLRRRHMRQNYWSLFVWPWNFFVQSP